MDKNKKISVYIVDKYKKIVQNIKLEIVIMKQYEIIVYCVILSIEQMGGLNTTHLLYFFKRKL